MTSEPWWRSESDPHADPPVEPPVDPFGPAVAEAARLVSSLREQATSPAVQETVAGGLTFVAAFLRGMASPTEPGAGPDAATPLVVVADTPVEDVAPEQVHGHLGAECRSCPVCQGLALLREVDPALVDGLGDALDSLVAAARSWVTPS